MEMAQPYLCFWRLCLYWGLDCKEGKCLKARKLIRKLRVNPERRGSWKEVFRVLRRDCRGGDGVEEPEAVMSKWTG